MVGTAARLRCTRLRTAENFRPQSLLLSSRVASVVGEVTEVLGGAMGAHVRVCCYARWREGVHTQEPSQPGYLLFNAREEVFHASLSTYVVFDDGCLVGMSFHSKATLEKAGEGESCGEWNSVRRSDRLRSCAAVPKVRNVPSFATT